MYLDLIIAAFLMGITGSLHCVGMCGPIVLSIPWNKSSKRFEILLYHLGRILTYALMGGTIGTIGKQIFPKDLGAWPALLSGIILVLVFFIQQLNIAGNSVQKTTNLIRRPFAKLFNQTQWISRLFLGLLNGILPCGLVYMALAMTTHYSGFWQGFLFMTLFGLGTSPLLIFLQSLKLKLSKHRFFQKEKTIRYTFLLLGILFILRGANLGIPFLSPSTSEKSCCSTMHDSSCH